MRCSLLALMFVLLVAAPARAKMDIGMSDDLTVVNGFHDRALALRQFKAMGGTHVRINIQHKRNRHYSQVTDASATQTALRSYDAAVDAVRAAGLTPQMTLIWRGITDPARLADWMGNVAAHFDGRVRRFSILNEPDLVLPAHGACGRAGERRFLRSHASETFVFAGHLRAVDVTRPHGIPLHLGCLRAARGRAYRRIVRWAAPAIRDGAPGAQVLAGETSGTIGLAWFVRAARPRRMHVAGWAHHPFQLRDLTPGRPAQNWGIGNLPRIKRLIGKPLYLTEFGYPHPHSSMDRRVTGRRLSQKDVARALPNAWRVARRAHVREMLQYQWFVKPPFRTEFWETALLDKDNGHLTPAYRALRSLIRSWRR